MASSQNSLNELSLLMELRLAFGPGTRLWAYTSREELCYDWLHFKSRRAQPSFREFALGLYAQEKEHALPCASSVAMLRRIAAVLRTYRIRRQEAGPQGPSRTAHTSHGAKPHGPSCPPSIPPTGVTTATLPSADADRQVVAQRGRSGQ